jgi:outer membrane protein assembly factor BamB
MRICVRLALVALLAGSGFRALASPESAPLGSTEYRPAADRPFGWRGDGTGRFPGATPPTRWSLTQNVRWSAAVGKSYSSPILTDKLVLVTSEPDLVVCLDRKEGKEVWRARVTPADLADPGSRAAAEEYKPKDTGLAAATPVTDGASVYAVFANGVVRAFDLGGTPRWIAYIDAKQNTAYGRSASPLLVAGRLIVHMTNLYAFDPASGKQLWVNTEARCAYGSPVALRSGGVDLVVTPAGDVIRVDDGKGVNSQIGNSSNSSPVVQDGTVYFGEKDVRAIRLGADFKDESVWNSEIPGEVFGSPLFHSGILFTASGKGELFAFDAAKKGSAEPLIDARALFGEPGAEPVAYSSLTMAGPFLFLTSNQGEVVVLEATKEARPVAKNKLKDGSGSSPVFSGKEIFLRDGDRLYCIGK